MNAAKEPALELQPADEDKTLEWITVLSAAGLDYRLRRLGGQWVILVPARDAEAAQTEIRTYEDENRDWPPPPRLASAPPLLTHPSWSAAWGVGFLIGLYIWLGPYDPHNPALRLAAADADRILAGEGWRLLTALTIHADAAHLAANAVVLLFFAHAVCRFLGGGLGWLLMLTGGVAGNAAVAALWRTDHVSVGASTTVFAAIGILCSVQTVRALATEGTIRSVWSRLWIPLGTGVVLLAWLGTGPQSDIAAHAFGFLSGIILALPFARHGAEGLPPWAQMTLEMLCLLAVLSAWAAVLRLTP